MDFKYKRVLVTGGAGVIGLELINMLKDMGAIIRCVDIVEKPHELDEIEYLQLDLSNNKNQPLFRFRPDYIFHLAADFERSEESPEFWDSNFRNNILCSHNVLKEALSCPTIKKIIFASSYLIYDKDLYSKENDVCWLKEDSKINPRNICGIAKLQTEADLKFISENSSISYACARIYRVYGVGSVDIISRWVRYALNGKELTLFTPDNEFDYIFAKDVAEGLLRLCVSEKSGIFNLGTGKPTKIQTIIDILKEELQDVKVKVIENQILPEKSCADMSKFKRDMNWVPTIDIRTGIQKIIEHEKKGNKYGRFDQY